MSMEVLTRVRKAASRMMAARPAGRVVRLAARPVTRDPDGCQKCGSRYLAREPAFLHCRYCGNMSRITDGSLLEQELFELRSGLRLAS